MCISSLDGGEIKSRYHMDEGEDLRQVILENVNLERNEEKVEGSAQSAFPYSFVDR